jgi:predicted nucleotidyltransferase
MFTQKSLIEYVSGYVKACNELGIHFNKVILFGSYAKGTAHKWSDIDLALVSDDFSGSWSDNRDQLAPATISYCDIEPHPYKTEYFNSEDAFIKEEILPFGKELKILETV